MEDWLSALGSAELLQSLRGMPPWAVYVTLAVSSVIENVFPPWPGDTVTVIGGALASTGKISLGWTMAALVVGNLIGAYIMYFLGAPLVVLARRVHRHIRGPRLVKDALGDLVSDESMLKTRDWFSRWGSWFILVSRFSAGIRFFVSIVAGISRMNLVWFSFVFTAGVLLWNTLLLAGGYTLGRQWDRILVWLRVYNTIAITAIVVAGLAFFAWRFLRPRLAAGPSSTVEPPDDEH